MADELANDATSEFDSWEPSLDRLALADGEVHVWRASLGYSESVLPRFEAALAADEKARAQRFIFQPDRNSYIVARGVLRELLGKYLNRGPSEIEFDYGAQGKPALRSGWSQSGVQFNVSHSHGTVLFAFAVARQVGVDVELVRPDFAGEKIAERFFSPQEVRELQIPLKSFHVSLTPSKPARLQANDSSRWSLRSLRLEGRYVGALVGEGKGWKLRGFKWRP
jgi:4'-phosphopantetheinyl transferase